MLKPDKRRSQCSAARPLRGRLPEKVLGTKQEPQACMWARGEVARLAPTYRETAGGHEEILHQQSNEHAGLGCCDLVMLIKIRPRISQQVDVEARQSFQIFGTLPASHSFTPKPSNCGVGVGGSRCSRSAT